MPTDHLRLQQRLDELAAFRLAAASPLGPAAFSTEGITPRPLELGESWPLVDGLARLDFDAAVPKAWTDGALRLQLSVGGEALLRVNGATLGGVNPHHTEHDLTRHATAGDAVRVELEVMPYGPFGTPNHRPRLDLAHLVLVDPQVEALWQQAQAMLDAARALNESRSDLGERLAGAVQEALAACPLPRSPAEDYRTRVAQTFRTPSTPDGGALTHLWERWEFPLSNDPLPGPDRSGLRKAQRLLEARLDELRAEHGPEGRLLAVGHTHIDLAWLWPLGETRRKGHRSLATALELMRADYTFVFAQASPQIYAYLEEDAPEVFEAVRARVAEGRWELLGGAWVEPDGNLPSGEAWVRQLLLGQRYFEERFGRRARVSWLPDTFGYAGNLPQLFADAGLPYFFTTKLNWNDTNPFPHDLYWWEGLDGSRVLTHSFHNPDGNYNGPATADSLLTTWRNFRGKRHHRTSLYTFGYGDGGGGPTPEMLARVRAYREFPGLPRVEAGTVEGFFDEVDGEKLPVWRGEQYLEYHRGTYTAQARTKALNRRLETALPEAEAAATLARVLLEHPYPREGLEAAWTVLLRNQFHDILPGSSVRTVYAEAEAELSTALERADELRRRALQAMSCRIAPNGDSRDALVVWNLALHDRPLELQIELTDRAPVGLFTDTGEAIPHARDGLRLIVATDAVTVPGMGYRALSIGAPPDDGDAPAGPATRDASPGAAAGSSAAGTCYLENAYLRAEIGADGTVHRLLDKVAGREVLAGRANQIWAYPDVPGNYDAWEIDAAYAEEGHEIVADEALEVLNAGPVEAVVRVRRSVDGASSLDQDYRLGAGSARLEVRTRIDWQHRRTLLRAQFPLAVRSHEAYFETAFGAVARPTHANTAWDAARFEVPGHRWADLSEADYGVSLLSDAKYGYSARDGILGLSLLRGPVYPDPVADEGEHAFSYALYPHAGDWRGGTVEQAHDFNAPLCAVRVRADEDAAWPAHDRLLAADGTLALAALKLREDADVPVARFVESRGTRGTAVLGGALAPTVAARTNLLEDRWEGDTAGAELAYRPFQILTAELQLRRHSDASGPPGSSVRGDQRLGGMTDPR